MQTVDMKLLQEQYTYLKYIPLGIYENATPLIGLNNTNVSHHFRTKEGFKTN